jgi:hypothetical protein
MPSKPFPDQRPLEGPGSEARLRSLQQRFRKISVAIDQNSTTAQRRFWFLCAAVFLVVFSVGLWLT